MGQKSIFLRFWNVWGHVSNARSLADLLWISGVTVLTFGVPAWAAYATHWISQYGPIAWVSVGLIGWLLGIGATYLMALARARWTRTTLWRKFYEQPDKINPLDKVFEHKRIYFKDLFPPKGILIEEKTFIDCELVGPVVLGAISEVGFEYCGFIDSDYVLMASNVKAFNTHTLKSCKFIRCKLFSVTILVPEQQYAVAQAGGGANWITHTPDNPPAWKTKD